jgi:peroxiredoxin
MTNNLILPLDLYTPAPDFTLTAHTGEPIHLSDYQDKTNVVLFFVRTYTCPQCRDHVRLLGQHYNDFKGLDTEVLVVLHGDLENAKGYADVTQAPFPVLADPKHEIYERYNLNKVFLFSTRTASVVVDRAGKITYLKSATAPWTWPKETTMLLTHLRSLKPIPA